MLSERLFFGLVLLVAIQRLLELRLSRHNELELRRLGAREHAERQMRPMQLLHALWLVSMLLEVQLLAPAFRPGLAAVAGLTFCGGQALRYAAIRALGRRWSVRVLTLPGAAPVGAGVYRYLRHPNYLGVVLEVAALPLVHAAWRTAALFSLLNAVMLTLRIRAEERALAANGRYDEVAEHARFWARLGARRTP